MNINGVRSTVPLLVGAQNYVNFYYDFTIKYVYLICA